MTERRASAAELHGLEPSGDRRLAEWFEVTRPAMVLGSAQREEVVDAIACESAGIDIVRRRSGGGVVLLVPGESLWLDVILPRGDALWHDDVARAMWWLGDVWCEALAATGLVGTMVHRGPLIHTPWSRLVCFDGVGSGEVLQGGRKVVGISQRRTRSWLRLQSSVHLVWRPELLVSLLARSGSPLVPTVADLQAPVTLGTSAAEVRTAVEHALQTR